VEWKYPLMVRRKDLNPAQLRIACSRKTADLPADVILSLVPTGDDDPIPQKQLVTELQARGMGINRANDTIEGLVGDGVIYKWALSRSGTRAAIAYHQETQQPVDALPQIKRAA
jgi:hypothetical protein